jgi:antitoxin VapB
MMTRVLSRIFMNGNSQAVRIPQQFRLDATQVTITRTANGDLLLSPLPKARGAALAKALSAFDADFVELLEEDRRLQPTLQEREAL